MSGGNGLKLSSTVGLTANMSGVSVTAHTRLDVIAQRPGRFRITATRVSDQGAAQQRFVLVSNGVKVWTYAPGTNRYSVRTLAAFDNRDDNFLSEGLVTSFYVGEGQDFIALLHSLNAGDSAGTLLEIRKSGGVLTQQPPSAGSPEETIYQLAIPKDKFSFYFHASTRTGQLTRFGLMGSGDGAQVTMQEDIAQISSLPSVPISTFYFAPPPGAVRAANVSVSP